MSITWDLWKTNMVLQLSKGERTNMETSRNASWKDFSKQQPNNLHIPQGKKKRHKTEKMKQNKQTPIKKKRKKEKRKHNIKIMCYL